MARRRFKTEYHPGKLNLTAMIAVALLLLSFVLIAIKPVDVLAHLKTYRPAPENAGVTAPSAPMIKILIFPPNTGITGYVINDTPMTMSEVEDQLKKHAATDPAQTVLIMCAQKATQKQLVELLDRCARYQMTNLSVVSLAGS